MSSIFMDEVQGRWEVPTIAHFCYVFREPFNLLYLGIAELEAAILNCQDPEMSISLDQLIIRLLQGCFTDEEITTENWEQWLHELFSKNCDEKANPLHNECFEFLSPQSKVEVLFKLCEFRLDTEESMQDIKDIPPEEMQARCIGKDSQNNSYWYFYDERLYKENPSAPKKNTVIKKITTKSGRQTAKNKNITVAEDNSPWSIVCHNISDWENLKKKFSKSSSKIEKELAQEIDKHLPKLSEAVLEKDRLLRKRYMMLAPKRMSSRICKVQAQKKLQEQQAEEIAEQKRIKSEKERMEIERNRKQQESEERQKRAEKREQIIQERLLRAQQRERNRRNVEDSDSDFEEETSRSLRTQSTSSPRRISPRPSTKREVDSDATQSTSSPRRVSPRPSTKREVDSNARRNSKVSSANSSSRENSVNEESENISSVRERVYTRPATKIFFKARARERALLQSNAVQDSNSAVKWNTVVDSKKCSTQILRCSNELVSNHKRFKLEGNTFSTRTTSSPFATGISSSNLRSSLRAKPLPHPNLITYSRMTTTSPTLIRIGLVKSPQQISS